MSSTYVHYGTPSSLPSDYALLSRYAPSHTTADDNDNEDDPRPRPRTVFAPPTTHVTESTPLLSGDSVPRIEEEVDEEETHGNVLWEEIKVLTRYTLPVFGTHLLEYSLVVASVVSLGHLSTTALAASTLGSMTASVTGYSILQGMTSVLDTLMPSAWTGPQPQMVGVWAQRMALVLAVCLFPIALIWHTSYPLLIFLHQPEDVAQLASTYLKWASLGLPAYGANGIIRRWLQSQGLFAVPTRIITVVAPINAALNYLLTYGSFSWNGLGFIGAPIATSISFNLIFLLSVFYSIMYVEKTAWHPVGSKESWARVMDPRGLGILIRLGLAGVGQTASEWWSWELVGLAASLLGPIPLACQSVLLVSASTTFQAPFALSVATSVRIGNLLGEANAQRAGVAAKAAMLMALVIGVVWSTMFMVFRNRWGYLFNDDQSVVVLVASILPLVALFQVFDGVSAVTGGILRAVGKQYTGALLNLSAYYIIGIPLGLYLAFRPTIFSPSSTEALGLHGLWTGLTVSLVYGSGIGVWICLKLNWEKEVGVVKERLRNEGKYAGSLGGQGERNDLEVGGSNGH